MILRVDNIFCRAPMLRPFRAPVQGPLERESRPSRFESVETAAAQHLGCMFATALAVVKSEDLAWDAVQDTLVRILEGRTTLPLSRGQLVQMTRLCSLQILRGNRRRQAHETRARQSSGSEEVGARFEREELMARLDRAVSGLGRAVSRLLRRRIEGFSYEEIAKEFDLPVGTVRSQLHRARQLLLDRLSRCPTCSEFISPSESARDWERAE